jgi:hypothetical protein
MPTTAFTGPVSHGPAVIISEASRARQNLLENTALLRSERLKYEAKRAKEINITELSKKLIADGRTRRAEETRRAAEEADEAQKEKYYRSSMRHSIFTESMNKSNKSTNSNKKNRRELMNEAKEQARTTKGPRGGFRHKKPSVPQSKEILGKQRRIYKVAGSRKEHVKYKGELIPVSDYKKLFKK